VTELDPAVAEQLADAMELRATDRSSRQCSLQAPLGQDIDLGGLFGHQHRLPLG
jgi:hypothetical protein